METRKPKKSEGVPEETPARNNIAALQNVLAPHLTPRSQTDLRTELEKRGFFAASMLEQVRMMAQVAFEFATKNNASDVARQHPAPH